MTLRFKAWIHGYETQVEAIKSHIVSAHMDGVPGSICPWLIVTTKGSYRVSEQTKCAVMGSFTQVRP